MGVGTVSTGRLPPPAAAAIALDDDHGRDPGVVGAKAAALGRARQAGLPVLPGFAITTTAARAVSRGTAGAATLGALSEAWTELSGAGALSLVVRSSSIAEDGESSSMAGRFMSVLDVRDWESFLAAVADVVGSAGDEPMGVLVQPFLESEWGGVLFGADPVTGRSDRLVVSAVHGGPDRLVSGQVDGVQFTLSPRGRLGDATDRLPDGLRRRRVRRRLAQLARRAAAVFGSPQDVEWAIDHEGRVVLLQSRPITALGPDVRGSGPVFGPGPVAETFPRRLRPLEDDLWVSPLRDGLREALRIIGTTPARTLRRSPLVVVVNGWVAADLDVLGLATRRRSLFTRLDPRPPARRLKAAWRVGRLRVALPALADDLLDDVDTDLATLPPLESLAPSDLVHLLRRAHQTLVALHGHEVLAGSLLGDDGAPTAAAIALRVLAAERGEDAPAALAGATDDELVARHPVLLSLVPPSVGAGIQLPPPPASPPPASPGGGEASVRESLRLRIRWVHELTARAAIVLGTELVRRGALLSASNISNLRLDEVAALIDAGGSLATELRVASPETVVAAPLPAAFRLIDGGMVVPVATGEGAGGRGAGGGRGTGPVHIGTDDLPAAGDVLVVRTLDPALAGVLPRLGGLVAETGSVLSHLAILAREYGVPTVVGLAGAADRFTDGTWVIVDGSTGEVSACDDREWTAA